MKWSEINESITAGNVSVTPTGMMILRRPSVVEFNEGTGLNYDLLAQDIWEMALKGPWPKKDETPRYLWNLLTEIKHRPVFANWQELADAMRANVGHPGSDYDQRQYWLIRRAIDDFRAGRQK